MVILTVGNFIMIYRQTGNRYIPRFCEYEYDAVEVDERTIIISMLISSTTARLRVLQCL